MMLACLAWTPMTSPAMTRGLSGRESPTTGSEYTTSSFALLTNYTWLEDGLLSGVVYNHPMLRWIVARDSRGPAAPVRGRHLNVSGGAISGYRHRRSGRSQSRPLLDEFAGRRARGGWSDVRVPGRWDRTGRRSRSCPDEQRLPHWTKVRCSCRRLCDRAVSFCSTTWPDRRPRSRRRTWTQVACGPPCSLRGCRSQGLGSLYSPRSVRSAGSSASAPSCLLNRRRRVFLAEARSPSCDEAELRGMVRGLQAASCTRSQTRRSSLRTPAILGDIRCPGYCLPGQRR